ncbi:MAG: hypothetical protein A3F78_00725 [Burkholderiales bacterium RIFCSPLOWO2_12_FULL_61_40]|nr:MAG: hypothetical protein A3F78_00725 [Burkholderiales bacterium RIFCSPLOWO2_12_FULL_61_40]
MSDSDTAGFGKFVPGFDFLQNLAKGAGANIPQMPNLGNWVAPTLNVEELDKRIEELKNVHFWLEQNSRALGATIQALEVQKMTLNTLKGMNFNIADVANALKLKAADSVYSGVQRVSERAASTAKTIADVASGSGKPSSKDSKTAKAAGSMNGLIDPLQLWGSLTQQFQQIAAGAVKEATAKSAVDITKNVATGMAKEAMKSGKKVVGAATRRTGASAPAAKSARKTAPRTK